MCGIALPACQPDRSDLGLQRLRASCRHASSAPRPSRVALVVAEVIAELGGQAPLQHRVHQRRQEPTLAGQSQTLLVGLRQHSVRHGPSTSSSTLSAGRPSGPNPNACRSSPGDTARGDSDSGRCPVLSIICSVVCADIAVLLPERRITSVTPVSSATSVHSPTDTLGKGRGRVVRPDLPRQRHDPPPHPTGLTAPPPARWSGSTNPAPRTVERQRPVPTQRRRRPRSTRGTPAITPTGRPVTL
jgi:hypothetical protein